MSDDILHGSVLYLSGLLIMAMIWFFVKVKKYRFLESGDSFNVTAFGFALGFGIISVILGLTILLRGLLSTL